MAVRGMKKLYRIALLAMLIAVSVCMEGFRAAELKNAAASVRYNSGGYQGAYEDLIFDSIEALDVKTKQFYDSINVTEPYAAHQEQLDNLYAFLQRNPSTVTKWERDAMLAYLDSCVIEDGRGEMMLDYDKIGMILTGFYREEDNTVFRLFRSYTKYYASDMLTYISEEYNEYCELRAAAFSCLDDSLTEYANLNAILNATDRYYRKLRTDVTYGEAEDGSWGMLDFGIKVCEEYSKNWCGIVVSTVEHDHEEFKYHLKPFALPADGLYNDAEHDIYITYAGFNTNLLLSLIMRIRIITGDFE